jgi:hypothetical protein
LTRSRRSNGISRSISMRSQNGSDRCKLLHTRSPQFLHLRPLASSQKKR